MNLQPIINKVEVALHKSTCSDSATQIAKVLESLATAARAKQTELENPLEQWHHEDFLAALDRAHTRARET